MNQSVNISAASGRILDANMAVKLHRLVKNQILSQAAQYVLSASYMNKNAVFGTNFMRLLKFIFLAR